MFNTITSTKSVFLNFNLGRRFCSPPPPPTRLDVPLTSINTQCR
jgi:hypothetical protein